MSIKDIFVVKRPITQLPRVKGVRFLTQPFTIHEALDEPRTAVDWKKAAWLAVNTGSADMLFEEVRDRKSRPFGTLAILEQVTPSRLAIATKYFRTVSQSGLEWLPAEQVIRILHSHEPRDQFVAGMVDKDAGNLLFYRGDLQPITAPLESFKHRGSVEPDFDDFEIIDWGHTVRFGKFEAATDAILYENDPEFRRRKKHERRVTERTFGASLRRLRLQRELRQSDFEPQVTARTVAQD